MEETNKVMAMVRDLLRAESDLVIEDVLSIINKETETEEAMNIVFSILREKEYYHG